MVDTFGGKCHVNSATVIETSVKVTGDTKGHTINGAVTKTLL